MDLFVPPEKFYGPPSKQETNIENILKANPLKKATSKPTWLLGPPDKWEIFSRQQEAIDYAKNKDRGIMPFAFEHGTGQRSFLVCHPVVLWYIGTQRNQDERCTYEIIREGINSKLYLDIEFETEFNQTSNGNRMLESIIKIICQMILDNYQICCSFQDVLDLDSSTDRKFSHHVIFQLSNAAFENNLVVGNFVKSICQEIKEAVNNSELMEKLCQKCGVSEDNIRELIVSDRKGIKKPFIDTAVYTRNRHFRLLGSTKLGKNAPLIISSGNLYVPKVHNKYSLFLSSLVTYFDKEAEKILTFGPNTEFAHKEFIPTPIGYLSNPVVTEMDGFFEKMIQPNGKIRKKYFTSNRIIYDIVGYRFCGNIGREHKSNNIKLVVDLDLMEFYQTCYDPDCSGYRSRPTPLPSEIVFPAEDEPVLMEAVDNLVTDLEISELMAGNCECDFFNEAIACTEAQFNFSVEDDSFLLAVTETGIDMKDTSTQNVDGNLGYSFSDNLSDEDLAGIAEAADLCGMNEDTMF